MRRIAAFLFVFVLLTACGGGEGGELTDLVPALTAAETMVPRALVCPELDAVESEYRPLLEGTLEELESEIPAAVRDVSTRVWVTGGARIKIGIWSDINARPTAMMFVAELESGLFGLSKVRYCA
jgi:hypothetical protein